MTPEPFLAVALAGLGSAVVLAPRRPLSWLALMLIGTGALLAASLVVLAGGADWDWHGGFRIGGEIPHLRLDGLSGFFLALVGVVGAADAIYAREYWNDREHPDSAPRGRMWSGALVLAMAFVLLSCNGLHFLIAWELFTVSGYFLIALDRAQRNARAAGWLYLAASHVGGLGLFAFFGLLAARTGSWELGPMRESAGLAPLFWLALGGFGVKAGLFPLHVWLPSAHANAPSHVSALMSGVAIKMGVYGIVRFSGWLPVPAAAGWTVMGLGAAGAVLGITFALAQNDLKRLLAYCTVENVGIIMLGLGASLLAVTHGAAPWGRLALMGALLHVWNHGLFKSLLFFGAGSVLHATGTREMTRLGGLWRTMPWTAGLFALGAAAICGLPPLNGFVSEWLVYLGLFDAAADRGQAAWAAIPAVIVLAVSGALAVATFVKAGGVVFLGNPRTAKAKAAHDCGTMMRAPMLALAAGCAVIGCAPAILWPVVARATSAWRPVSPMTVPPWPGPVLSLTQTTLAAAFLAVGVGLWWWVRGQAGRRELTWDCGFRAPTARMQYTGGSFSGIVAGWFSMILQPERSWRRPRGLFPAGAGRWEGITDLVLTRIVEPAGRAIQGAALVARRLQHGRVQSYIVYLIAGLVVLGLLVLLGGGR